MMRFVLVVFALGCVPEPDLVDLDGEEDVADSSDPPIGPSGDDDDDTTTPPDETATPVDSYDGGYGVTADAFEGRDYWLYVPDSYDPAEPAPLVVGFHGAGDNGASFFAQSDANGFFSAADDQGFLLLIAETRSPYSDWANWSGNPNNDFDDMEDELADLFRLIADIDVHWNVDDAGLHGFGFSNGGLFLGVAGFAAADRFASLACLGYGWGAFYIVTPPSLVPVQVVIGSADSFAAYADQTAGFLASQGHDTRYEQVPGVGHSFSGLTAAVPADDLTGWMLDHQ